MGLSILGREDIDVYVRADKCGPDRKEILDLKVSLSRPSFFGLYYFSRMGLLHSAYLVQVYWPIPSI
jgi:hypothetical protein